MPPVQVRGEVLAIKQMGAYWAMTVVASGIAEQTRPGQFVAVAVGGDDGSMLLHRAFSIYQVASRGVYGGTVEFIFAAHGKGTSWLARQRAPHPLQPVGPRRPPLALSRGRRT